MLYVIASVVISVALTYGYYRALLGAQGLRGRTALELFVAAAVLAVPARLFIAYVLDSFGWAIRSSSNVSAFTAWGSAVVVVAGLEHLVLVVVISPIYRSHRLERLGTAFSAAGIAAAGYGTANAAFGAFSSPGIEGGWVGLLTNLSSVFFAAVWASCLSLSHVRYRAWFPVAWFGAVACDGSIRYGLVAHSSGVQVLSSVLVVAMVVSIVVLLQKLQGHRPSIVFVHPHRFSLHVDGHKLESVRAAFQHAHRPALVHWIVGGAFVSFGASLLGLACGVVLARWFSIDLSRVDETNKNALVPLLLLGGCVVLSFPLSGFLTAKASSADSLFEPGMAALISISALTALLARSAPVTLLLGLVIAPIAFALACLGAWLGHTKKP